MKIKELYAELNEKYPTALSCEWDNDGIMCADNLDNEVKNVLEEIKEAAHTAQASEFIEKMPEGYEGYVAEKGASLSGGQKQRLSIARAILRKPDVLIFDDSTSALDLSTEAKLRQKLFAKLKGTTVITIAQRIASVKNCDRIAVIDDGCLVAIGTHEELLETSDVYRDIYDSQMKKGDVQHA